MSLLRAGLLLLAATHFASAVNIVGRQTASNEWTYDLTFAPFDNFSITQANTTITISGLCGVVSVSPPLSNDFPEGLNARNLEWTPTNNGGTSVTWTKVGSGTGNFGEDKHIYGFKIQANGAQNGTATLATSGVALD